MGHRITDILVTIVSVLLLLIGLAVIIMGVMVTTESYLKSAFRPAGDKFQIEITPEALKDIYKYAHPFGIGLVVAGILVMFTSGIQLIACCIHTRTIMIGYAVCLTILIVMHCIVLGIYFGDRELMMKDVNHYMKKGIKDYNANNDTTKVTVLNLVMPSYKCCGYTGGSDFTASSLPATCCKSANQGPTGCPSVANKDNSYKDQGCDTMFNWYALISIALLILHVIALIITAINLTCNC